MKQLYVILALLVVISVIRLFAPKIRGKLGEASVSGRLSALPKDEYSVLNDIMLKTDRGTSQIDHIVVSRYGVFVIETKNYKGRIQGGENSEEWTENIYGKKYRFRNPIMQNYGHVKALESILALPSSAFIPIVVFPDSVDIKVQSVRHVINLSSLTDTVKAYRQLLIEADEVPGIVKKLEELNITDGAARREHVNTIRGNVRDAKKKTAAGICPKCGGELVLRSGKYGKFYGCGNYPKCRYTKKV